MIDIKSFRNIKFDSTLRFRIKYLEIKMENYFFPFPQLEFQHPNYPKITFRLEEILFDTGNEADYNLLVLGHFEQFKRVFNLTNSDFTPRSQAYVSKRLFSFRFDKTIEFKSRIGFLSECPENWCNTINIGMNSFIQFKSLIYPSNSRTDKHTFYFMPNEFLA